jgi:YD repeat-containing protein
VTAPLTKNRKDTIMSVFHSGVPRATVLGLLMGCLVTSAPSQGLINADRKSTAERLFLAEQLARPAGHTPVQKNTSAIRVQDPQSGIFVIDTALLQGINGLWGRHLYRFNARGKISEDVREELELRVWLKADRNEYTYDRDGNMLSDLGQEWSDGRWQNSRMETYAYDANGHRSSSLTEDWASEQWMPLARKTYTSTASGKPLSYLSEIYRDDHWENLGRIFQTYDGQEALLGDLVQNWKNGQWEDGFRHTYTSDAAGNMLTSLEEQWSGSAWTNLDRSSFTYDASGHMLSSMVESWDSTNEWKPSLRETFIYDANGNISSDIFETWSDTGWEPTNRTAYTYNADGKLVTIQFDAWAQDQKQWSPSAYTSYDYDRRGNFTSGISMAWKGSSWEPGMASFDFEDGAGNPYSYVAHTINLHYINIAASDVSDKNGIPLSFRLEQNYPNPFNPRTVVCSQLSVVSNVRIVIYDVLGREVSVLVNERRPAGTYRDEFDGSGLASGLYLYRMTAGSFVTAKKMLLLK